MAADEIEMWMSASKVVGHPSDEFCLELGRDVAEMVRKSMRKSRKRDELEPIGHIVLTVRAS